MNHQNQLNKHCHNTLFLAAAALLASILPFNLHAQGPHSKGELATCQVSVAISEVIATQANKSRPVKNKTISREILKKYNPGLNQLGYFDQVSNIQPQQKVPVEVSYPNGRAGDKVVVIVADGGTLDNKEKVRVVQLDVQKKLSFSFLTANDLGIYRIMLRKGIDTKVVQLWVGAEPVPVKK